MGDTTVVGPGLTPDWLKKRKGIMEAIDEQLILGLERPGAGLNLDQLQLVVEHRNPFEPKAATITKVEELLGSYQVLARWRANYAKIGIEPNFDGVVIPEHKPGHRVLVVAQGITMDQVFEGLEKLFLCSRSHDDLDAVIPENERTPEKAYAIQVRDRKEADKELKNRSANYLRERKIATETVLERMLQELDYFLETGEHLDEENVSLCAGSRRADGSVPGAYWLGGKFQVDARWARPWRSNGDLRARAAVSV